jgi:hypothetical protein
VTTSSLASVSWHPDRRPAAHRIRRMIGAPHFYLSATGTGDPHAQPSTVLGPHVSRCSRTPLPVL